MIFNEKVTYQKIFLHIFLRCCAQYNLELHKQRVLHSTVLHHRALHSIVLPCRVVGQSCIWTEFLHSIVLYINVLHH